MQVEAKCTLKFLWKLWIFLFGMLMGYSLAVTLVGAVKAPEYTWLTFVVLLGIGCAIGFSWCLVWIYKMSKSRCLCEWIDSFERYEMNLGN